MTKPKTDDELYQIAMGMFQGRIFTDRHCRSPEDTQAVFMPLMFMAEGIGDDRIKQRADTKTVTNMGMVYEDMSKALPRSINGMPIFASMQFISPDETVRMFEMYNKLVKATSKEAIKDAKT